MSLRYRAIRGAFEILAMSRMMGLVRALSRARGVIFTLHRVLPDAPAAFAPNAILQVTPDFLEAVIVRVRELGLDIVSLDEAIDRIEGPGGKPPFAVFTFDDGYRDNLEYALPILRRQHCPFTLYLPTDFIEGTAEIWWQALEDIIAANDAVVSPDGSRYDTADLAGKWRAYDELYPRMRTMPEAARVAMIRALAERHRYDLAAQCRDLIMTWNELEIFAEERLCTIGAHTVHHYELAKLSAEAALDEITRSRTAIAEHLGMTPDHLSYPIGGHVSAGPREYRMAAELGFRSAVTTVPGGLYAKDRHRLTALPRVSLNGLFQKPGFIDVFATGAVFTALGRFTG
jgi:peptidoglycan/xylan/chitin deacetylase (PgdA/CDA1 family)